MFQKNFLGVKYLTHIFKKKRHLAVFSQKRAIPAPKITQTSPQTPRLAPGRLRRARTPPAPPPSGEPSNKLENQRQYRIHNRRRKNPLRRTVLV